MNVSRRLVNGWRENDRSAIDSSCTLLNTEQLDDVFVASSFERYIINTRALNIIQEKKNVICIVDFTMNFKNTPHN